MASNSYIYQQGTTPNTSLLNSQKVKVFAAHPGGTDATANQIGLLQSWAPAQSRPTEPVRGIGFGDRVAEQSVGVTELTGSLSIAVMYLVNIMQVLGYNAGASGIIRSLKHHRWPFDIKEQIVIPDFIKSDSNTTHAGTTKTGGISAGNLIQTYYEGCWMQDYNITFEIGASTIMQDCTVNITDIYDPTQGRGKYNESLVDRDPTTISKLIKLAA
ncbi:MAG: hypothetical protein Q7R33_01990 [Nitrosarchaeum sp.]|nr:hypothetical protein [Nitrosarchaeum sp.]